MSICLAATWYPRGELSRFIHLLPLLEQAYAWIVVSYIPSPDPGILEQLMASGSSPSHLSIYINDDQHSGRYLALQKALDRPVGFIHYADLDRLLHWVETRPGEWKGSLEQIERFDGIIFGRTHAAYSTHPQALIATENISNHVVSFALGETMDVSAGSKSFSRSAAQYLVDHCQSGNSIASDAEWPIILRQAGYELQYVEVDGLDWESADQYRERAASKTEQAQAAEAYDADPKHWARRVEIAEQIIHTALKLVKENRRV